MCSFDYFVSLFDLAFLMVIACNIPFFAVVTLVLAYSVDSVLMMLLTAWVSLLCIFVYFVSFVV